MSYTSFQNQVSSEKLTLAILHASKRLMAWTLHSGSIYKLTNFDVASIVTIEDSSIAYTEVDNISAVTASKFYNDRDNKILYLRTTGSDNPNSRFLVITQKLFFANAPITLPHDLSSGYEVYWEPMIKSTSSFGVEIDTINQTSEAIEGAGTLTLSNDYSFWPDNFDKLTFENKACYIYSFNRDLLATEAKLIFRGLVEKKSYKESTITFSLKDLLSQLKSTIPLTNLSDMAERTSEDLALAKKRMIFGRVYGHRPVNLDEVLTGYPLTGTISVTTASSIVTGTGTDFLTQLSPDDTIIISGTSYNIATVTSATSLTLTESYGGSISLSGISATVKPDQPKRYINRRWLVSGYTHCQPTTTIQASSSVNRLIVGSTENIYADDYVYIGTLGSGQLVKVSEVISSSILKLSTSLNNIPSIGTTLFKPSVQNVRLDDLFLTYYTDYTFDASTSILTLNNAAEKRAAPVKQMPNDLTFTNASRIITGTSLNTLLKPGYVVTVLGQADYFEVLSVDSSTQATLRSASTFTATNKGLFKSYIFNPSNSVLTCDVLGRTEDDLTTGTLLKTAPKIAKQLLTDLGLSGVINTTSFADANLIAYQEIGFVIPTKYNDTTVPTYRAALNKLNQSVFGSIIQNDSFQLNYLVLQPDKVSTALRLDEADILDFRCTSVADKVVKTCIVYYRPKEYNYLTKKDSINSQQKTSDSSTHLLKVDRQRTFNSYLVDASEAERYANRWSFILENSSTVIDITTKLQAITLEVGDVVDLSHRKLYKRLSSSSTRKLGLVESVKKSGDTVSISIVDLSNAFNRVCAITSVTTTWANTDEDGRLYGGFITDAYGVIDDDQNSFGTNLIY